MLLPIVGVDYFMDISPTNWNAPASLEELKRRIETTSWFHHLGYFPGAENTIAITTLEPSNDSEEDDWDWLPTESACPDPIHLPSLASLARQQDRYRDYLQATTEVYRLALRSMREMDENDPRLRSGLSDLTLAAQGAAAYAMRLAAGEIVLGMRDFWCDTVRYYFNGFWPCGLADDGQLVVF